MVDAGSLRHPTWGALVPERPPVCDWSRPGDGYTRQGTELACTPSLPSPPLPLMILPLLCVILGNGSAWGSGGRRGTQMGAGLLHSRPRIDLLILCIRAMTSRSGIRNTRVDA